MALSALTDFDLLDLLKEDNKSAFNELYKRYWGRLFVIACHTLGSAEEAEEVVHDVFLKLWKLRSELEIKKSLNYYLAAAVKCQVLNHLRTQARRQRLLSDNLASLTPETSEDPVGNRLKEKELMLELERTVQALPEKCQIVYRLSREEGYSARQIAEHLNISVSTVETHIAKALRVMRHQFHKLLLLLMFIQP